MCVCLAKRWCRKCRNSRHLQSAGDELAAGEGHSGRQHREQPTDPLAGGAPDGTGAVLPADPGSRDVLPAGESHSRVPEAATQDADQQPAAEPADASDPGEQKVCQQNVRWLRWA